MVSSSRPNYTAYQLVSFPPSDYLSCAVWCRACSCCYFSLARLSETPRTAVHQAPKSMGFSRQEYWTGLPFPSPVIKYEVSEVKSLHLCPTLCGPVDCSPSGSSVHGIVQARVLEWVTIPSFRGSSQARNQTLISYISSLISLPLVP